MMTPALPVRRNHSPRRPGAQLALNVLKLSPVAAAVIALLSPAWLHAQSDVQEARLALLRQSQVLVNTAASIVALRARDSDNDGTLEPPAMAAGAGPTGGGLLPTGVAIQQTDGYGTALGYCAWDQGSATSLPDMSPEVAAMRTAPCWPSCSLRSVRKLASRSTRRMLRLRRAVTP